MLRLLPAYLLGGVLCLTAQQTEPVKDVASPAGEKKGPCKLEGRTTNAVTGEPVRRVNLRLTIRKQGETPVAVASDNDGHFLFENLEPGEYYLMAERAGFVRQAYGSRPSSFAGTPLTLLPGQHIKDLEFKLTPQGVITGRVLDGEGEPVTRVLVTASREGKYGSRSRMSSVGGSPTNDIGEFRIANLTPGRYFVRAAYRSSYGEPAVQQQGDEPEESYVPTFYPGTTDLASAVPIELGAGQQVSGIEITLRKGRVYRIEGRISGTLPEESRRNLRLTLMPRKRDYSTMIFAGGGGSTVKPDGSFEIRNVQPGSYHVIAMRLDESYMKPQGRVAVDVIAGNVEGVVLSLGGSVDISGTVRVEGDEKVEVQRGRITLRPAEGIAFNSPGAMVKPDGSFKLESVMADKYYFSFYGFPDTTYVRSVRMGNQEVLEKGLDLSQGQSPAAVEVILSTKPGSVGGSVKDDKDPAPGGWVALIPDPVRPEQMHLYRFASADQNGRFNLNGVAPGEYKIYAFEEAQPEILRDLELLKTFEQKGTKVTVRENTRENVELTVLKIE
jgi:hypothetical protein